MEKYSKHTARFLSCAVILMLSACSSTPRLNLLQDSAKVAILSPVVTQQGGALKIHNQAIGGDAKTGVGSGALAGAAVGLSCGPLVIFCAPV
ncbi:MAG: hypothetical protein K9K86_05720, partial [Pseudomonadales bacterium]|nr:hypothetical protein [Pseudomonadales bacterium]